MIDMLIGALIFALGLASGVFVMRHPKPHATPQPTAQADKYGKYRNPATGLLSTRMVEAQSKGEAKGR